MPPRRIGVHRLEPPFPTVPPREPVAILPNLNPHFPRSEEALFTGGTQRHDQKLSSVGQISKLALRKRRSSRSAIATAENNSTASSI
jgi:hypothetical protein